MLKWLRKYNTFILVVGGCLLMVAFLLQSTLTELSQRGMIGGTIMRVDGQKYGPEQYGKLAAEYHAIGRLLGRQEMLPLIGAGENDVHWILLSREAEKAGLVGGVQDGREYIGELAADLAEMMATAAARRRGQFFPNPQDVEATRVTIVDSMTTSLPRVAGESRMTEDQVLLGLAKLRGVLRMQNAYASSLRFSDRRLVSTVRKFDDAVEADYVLVPADREVNSVPEPDAAAITAHYEKFKATKKGEGDFGIGYTLPERVKLEWLTLDRRLIEGTVAVDPIEVEKRLLKRFPSGTPPEGVKIEDERARISDTVRNELADRVMSTATQAIRGEIGKAVRTLDADQQYHKLSTDWSSKMLRLESLRAMVVERVAEAYRISLPLPTVVVRDQAWVERTDLERSEGIGRAFLRRGSALEKASDVVFGVREIAGDNDYVVQVGVANSEPLEDNGGNRYFFTVLDARKTSPPDTMDEVKPQIIKDLKRLAAYEKLKAQQSAMVNLVNAQGFEVLTKAPEGATGDAASTLRVQQATVSRKRVMAMDRVLDTPEFRDAVAAIADPLDPTIDVTTVDAPKRTGSIAIDKALGVAVYRIKKLAPVTAERYRQQHGNLLQSMIREELNPTNENSPFALKAMEKRFNVVYEQQQRREKEEAASKGEPTKSS